MYRNTPASCNITDNLITRNRIAASGNPYQAILYSFNDYTVLRYFFGTNSYLFVIQFGHLFRKFFGLDSFLYSSLSLEITLFAVSAP